MTRHRRTKDWECSRKTKFKTYEAASSERRKHAEDVSLKVYRCPYCDGWHLGHRRLKQ